MPPITLLVKPASGLCNMRCRYCFYADVMAKSRVPHREMMSDETLETLVSSALREADGEVTFAFQGGEPTLRGKDFFYRYLELVRKYNQKGLKVNNTLQTNGYLIDEDWARILSEGKFLVGLSVDGTKTIHDKFRPDQEGKGTFDRVMKAAETLKKHDVDVNALCVVNNVVAKNGAKVINSLINLGFDYIQFIPCLDGFGEKKNRDFSLEPQFYARFLKETFDVYYDRFMRGKPVSVRTFDNYAGILMGYPPESCGMSGVCACYFTVEGDGSVYPCDFYVIDRYVLGKTGKNTFEEMAASDAAKTFIAESKTVDPECLSCRWRALCRGGCRRNRQTEIGGNLKLNEYCSAFKEFFAYAYERLQFMVNSALKNNQ